MVFLEENFENMLLKKYSDKEIELLQSVIASLKDFKMVEGIILIPFIKCDKKYISTNEFDSDFVIFVNKNEGIDNEIETLINNIKAKINDCDDKISDTNFYIWNINVFNNKNFSFYKMAFESFLVSSYILYDKNKNLTKLQGKLGSKTRAITGNEQVLVKIDNVDKLDYGLIKTKKKL